MSIRPPVLSALAALAAAACVLCGCSSVFDITASGSVSEGVTFRFQDAEGRPVRLRLAAFEVHRRDPAGGWKTIWKTGGSGRVKQIAFGTAPPGFFARPPAEPIRPGQLYRMSAHSSGPGTVVYGGGSFRTGSDGRVETLASPAGADR